MSLINKIRTAAKVYRAYGLPGILAYTRTKNRIKNHAELYRKRVERERLKFPELYPGLLLKMKAFDRRPVISLILPVYDIDEKWLRRCIDSVRDQIYDNWELCIADDASPSGHVKTVLDEYGAADQRIKVVFRKENGHISAASNSALGMASGEWVVLLDHDDELPRDALFWLVNEINAHPDAALIYSDEDKIDHKGDRHEPTFKPGFGLDLMYSLNLVNHLSAYRTSLLREVGGFRVGFEGSQDYDLALRVFELIDEKQIRHIPKILYHWRAVPGSVAFGMMEKPYAHERAREAIRQHLERSGKVAKVEANIFQLHHVRYAITGPVPRVSVVMFGWAENGENGSHRKKLAAGLSDIEFVDASMNRPLAEALNSAVENTSGEILIFISNRLRSISETPLLELARFSVQEPIGSAGGLAIMPDGTIASGGLVFDGSRVAVAHHGIHEFFPGNLFRNAVVSNFSAVSLDVMAIRKTVFRQYGGFDPGFRDPQLLSADLCLKLRADGLRVVLSPYAKFLCEKKGQKFDVSFAGQERFLSRWSRLNEADPFWNSALGSDGLLVSTES